METYKFFSRECVWFHVDKDIPEAKYFTSKSFRFSTIIGTLLQGYTGEQIYTNNFSLKVIKEIENMYTTMEHFHSILDKEGFLLVCKEYSTWYLYPSTTRIIVHQG
tara:strand:+ start:876 stop:1193 length:318 start_codon:yes stop_codon:yes gene_type:complete